MSFLANLLRSKAFKAAVGVLAAALAAYASAGCGLFRSTPKSPELAAYECQVAALAEAVPPEVAVDLVLAARAGQVEYVVRQLVAFGLDLDRVRALADAFNACRPDEAPPAPAVEPS